jgi:hypothetical protein
VSVQTPNPSVRYVAQNGTLTLEGLALLGALVRLAQEQAAQIADLTARVEALEP